MATVKLTVLSVENFSQQFGTTDYAVFTCSTPSNENIQVAVTHNLLERRGVDIPLLDNFVSSTLLVNDDIDSRTGELTSAEDRVQRVLDGSFINPRTGKPITLLTMNSANGSLIKSDVYKATTTDLTSSTNAKVKVIKDEKKKMEGALRLAERLKAQTPVSQSVTETSTIEAVLETNEEESPF